MIVYDARDYRHFMDACIHGEDARVWGAVKKLAAALKCHSTYVSQIIKGKAHVSTEQALAFCRYMQLDRDAAEFFLDLVNRDRAGNEETRAHFQDRIDRRLADRQDLKRRLKVKDALTSDQEARYYDGWLPQAVHICCQLNGQHTPQSIAQALRVDQEHIEAVLQQIASLGLVEHTSSGYRSVRDSVHLGKDSPLIGRFHSNWRMKTMGELMTFSGLPGSHYSSVVSMSHETAQQLREMILRHVEGSRDLIIPSPPDHLYVYCLDFYQLTHNAPAPRGTK